MLLFPFFEELSVLLTLLAILLLVPAQLLFPYREIDIVIDKKRFKITAQILGVVAITFLFIKAYLILTT